MDIDCHLWERKEERNERKQVHLPQVYNPEITVCSGACPTALQAACASLLISLAPAVRELIWRFSKSITLLFKVSLVGRCTHTYMWRACAGEQACAHTHAHTLSHGHIHTSWGKIQTYTLTLQTLTRLYRHWAHAHPTAVKHEPQPHITEFDQSVALSSWSESNKVSFFSVVISCPLTP